MRFQAIITMASFLSSFEDRSLSGVHPLLWPEFRASMTIHPEADLTIQDNGKGFTISWRDIRNSVMNIKAWLDQDNNIGRTVTCVTSEGVQRIHEEYGNTSCLRTSKTIIAPDGSYVSDVTVTRGDDVIHRFKTVADINGDETTLCMPLTA